jgi:hypothetical protein
MTFIKFVLGCIFCEKKPYKVDKIEKTLQTMLPSDRILHHQNCARNYQNYSDLIHDLIQAEKLDELTLKDHHQCFVSTAPLPKVHYNVKGKAKVDGSNNHQKNFGKFNKGKCNNKNKKNRTKGQVNGKDKTFKCHKCGGPYHFAKKCQSPQHLVELYQKSLKEANKGKRSYQAHFNDVSKEASTLGTKAENPKIPMMTDKMDMYMENTIVEYNSNDVFWGPKLGSFISINRLRIIYSLCNINISDNLKWL